MARADLKIAITPQIATVARPGDTILIGFDHTLDEVELESLYESFEDFTQTTGIHIAVVERATSMVVARPDRDDEFEKEFPGADEG